MLTLDCPKNNFMDKELNTVLTSIIFQNLKIINKCTPQDTYVLNYLNHWRKWGDNFYDLYHFCYQWGVNHKPSKILEIGTRTGTSLIQLLASYIEFPTEMRVVSFDRFDDGLSNPDLVRKHFELFSIPINIIEFYTGDSAETVPEFKKNNPNEKFDWVLVDGSHQEPCITIDLNNVVDIVTKDGVIVVDDINSQPEDTIDVKEAWNKFKNKYAQLFSFHENLQGKGVGWGVKL